MSLRFATVQIDARYYDVYAVTPTSDGRLRQLNPVEFRFSDADSYYYVHHTTRIGHYYPCGGCLTLTRLSADGADTRHVCQPPKPICGGSGMSEYIATVDPALVTVRRFGGGDGANGKAVSIEDVPAEVYGYITSGNRRVAGHKYTVTSSGIRYEFVCHESVIPTADLDTPVDIAAECRKPAPEESVAPTLADELRQLASHIDELHSRLTAIAIKIMSSHARYSPEHDIAESVRYHLCEAGSKCELLACSESLNKPTE